MNYKLEDIDTLFRDAIAKVAPSDDVKENANNGIQEIAKLLNSSNIIRHVKGICAYYPSKNITSIAQHIAMAISFGCGFCEPLGAYFTKYEISYSISSVGVTLDDRTKREFMEKLFDEINPTIINHICHMSITSFARAFRLESKLHLFTRTWEFPILVKDNNFASAVVFVSILQS